MTKQFLDQLVYLYTIGDSGLDLTPSTVGRLNLMLQESLNEYRSDPEEALKDFCCRIDSIKRKKEKEEAFRLLRSILLPDADENGTQEYRIDVSKMTRYQDTRLQEIWKCMRKYEAEEECKKRLADIWGLYVGNILTYHKYLKKHEGGSEKHGK